MCVNSFRNKPLVLIRKKVIRDQAKIRISIALRFLMVRDPAPLPFELIFRYPCVAEFREDVMTGSQPLMLKNYCLL